MIGVLQHNRNRDVSPEQLAETAEVDDEIVADVDVILVTQKFLETAVCCRVEHEQQIASPDQVLPDGLDSIRGERRLRSEQGQQGDVV